MSEYFRNVTKPRILALLDLLNENNVDYFASGGTLLGAVRHRGIIPWDNDCDLGIAFREREKAFEVLAASGKFYVWQHVEGGYEDSAKTQRYENRVKSFSELDCRRNIYITSADDDKTVSDLEIFLHIPLETIEKNRWLRTAVSFVLKQCKEYNPRKSYWWQNRDTYDLSQGLLVYGLEEFKKAKYGRFNIPCAMAFPLRAIEFYDRTIKVFQAAEQYLKIKYGENCLTHTSRKDMSSYEDKFFDNGNKITDFSPL
ncbi:LicD family protein [Thermodesulfobacteriota bacterium]